MTPLEELARLLRKHGHGAQAVAMASLAAREEARVEGEAFWADLARDLFEGNESLAAVSLGGANAKLTPDLELDRAAYRRGLFLVAQELRLRELDSPDSERWRLALKTAASSR